MQVWVVCGCVCMCVKVCVCRCGGGCVGVSVGGLCVQVCIVLCACVCVCVRVRGWGVGWVWMHECGWMAVNACRCVGGIASVNGWWVCLSHCDINSKGDERIRILGLTTMARSQRPYRFCHFSIGHPLQKAPSSVSPLDKSPASIPSKSFQ